MEKLLKEINSKIDNFLGFEELGVQEKEEVEEIRKEVRRGNYLKFEEVFE